MNGFSRTRLERMLDSDKEGLNEPSRAAALRDFRKVAEEYFEVDGELALTTAKEKGGEEVTLRFRARRAKNFSVLK